MSVAAIARLRRRADAESFVRLRHQRAPAPVARAMNASMTSRVGGARAVVGDDDLGGRDASGARRWRAPRPAHRGARSVVITSARRTWRSSRSARLRTASTPTVSVAKSAAPALRISVSVRFQPASASLRCALQRASRSAMRVAPRVRSTCWVSSRCARMAASRRPVRAVACQEPSTASRSISPCSQSRPSATPSSKYARATSATARARCAPAPRCRAPVRAATGARRAAPVSPARRRR